MDANNVSSINTIMNSSLVAALLGSLVGGLITWGVTSSSLKRQLKNEQQIRRDEDRKRLISALIPIKNEIKSNTLNLDEFTKNMSNCTIVLPKDIFSFDKINKYRDIVEVEKGIALSDEMLETSLIMKKIITKETKKEEVEDVINKGKVLQGKLEKIIEEVNTNLKV